jgi:hypothetical protein
VFKKRIKNRIQIRNCKLFTSQEENPKVMLKVGRKGKEKKYNIARFIINCCMFFRVVKRCLDFSFVFSAPLPA